MPNKKNSNNSGSLISSQLMMINPLTLWSDLVTKICYPNKQVVPDPQQQQTIFSHNKVTFTVLLSTVLFRAVMIAFMGYSPGFDSVQFHMMANFLVIFVILCRSWHNICHFSLTMASFLWCYYGLITYPDFVIYYLSLSFSTPAFVYFISKSIRSMILSAVLQIIALSTTYRRNLVSFLRFTDPEDFADKFTDYGIVVLIFIIGGYSFLLRALNQKTIEISKAVKVAEDALEQQKTFIYSFSHELRNPINSLLGNLQLVLMSDISREVREMVNTSKICGELLLNLINTMLDAGKLDIGKLEVNPTSTRVHYLLQRIWVISNDILTRKGIASHLKISKKVPPILLLDGHRIHQILMNLIGNAIKFTQKGSITITIQWLKQKEVTDKCFEPIPYDEEDEGVFEKEENMHFVKMKSQGKISSDYFVLSGHSKEFNLDDITETQDDPRGVLKIVVKDTGCGMAKDEVTKLFQKFSQVGNDNSKRQLGSGLGLFISKELCRAMKGDVRVYSRAGVGATFTVCIPTSAMASSHKLGLESQHEAIQKQLTDRNLKTMVADDSVFNVNLISNFFAKIGARVTAIADNGKSIVDRYIEALEAGQEVDVVTLDIDMPVMNGKTACEKIREYEAQHNKKPTIIILISGNYDEHQLTSYLERGQVRRADYFLRKPVLFDEFRWTIYKHVFKCSS